MLLDFILESDMNTRFSEKSIWMTYSPKQDFNTREICRFTESYLRLTFHENMCKNVIINDGQIPLHNILWQCRTLQNHLDFVVWVRPGILVYYDLMEKINQAISMMFNVEKGWDHIRESEQWGMIRAKEHDLFCILNYKHNDCFQGDSVDEWEKKCKTEKLQVIKDFDLSVGDDFYEGGHDELSTSNLKEWRNDFLEWTKSKEKTEGMETVFIDQMIPFTRTTQDELFSAQLPNLVYYDGYKFTKKELEYFENIETFHTIEELEKLVLEKRKDTLWIIGSRLIQPTAWWTMGYKRINSLSWVLRTLVNSIVWAKVYDRTDMKFSTVDNGIIPPGVYDDV
jgi:hypothetical protein